MVDRAWSMLQTHRGVSAVVICAGMAFCVDAWLSVIDVTIRRSPADTASLESWLEASAVRFLPSVENAQHYLTVILPLCCPIRWRNYSCGERDACGDHGHTVALEQSRQQVHKTTSSESSRVSTGRFLPELVVVVRSVRLPVHRTIQSHERVRALPAHDRRQHLCDRRPAVQRRCSS